MPSKSLLALSLVLSAAPAAATCTADLDCQLNGACTAGACVCDRGWRGPDCGDLDIDDGSVAYGFGSPLTPTTTSWGAGPPYFDGTQYHLLVTEIAYNCGMSAWSHFSQAAHAVSPTLEGPYKRVDTAVGIWTHNTLYAFSPRDKMHLLFSIGEGNTPEHCNPRIQCENGRTPGGTHLRPPSPWPANVTCPPSHTTTVHYSASIDGPWTSAGPVTFNGSPPHPLDPTQSSFGTSNPAPLVLPNGTVLMVTRGKDAVDGHKVHNLWLWKASHWNATYELQILDGVDGAVNAGDGHTCLTEDPVLYRGRRGYHMIIHSSPRLTHAWSEDALAWHWSANLTGPQPSASGNDHERPRVQVDANGDLAALFVSHIMSNTTTDEAATLVYLPR